MLDEMKTNMDLTCSKGQERLENFFQQTEDGKILRDWKITNLKNLETIKENKVESSRKIVKKHIAIHQVMNEIRLKVLIYTIIFGKSSNTW